MIVTGNEYLDARRPEWVDAELLGQVQYELQTHTVRVKPGRVTNDIISALGAHYGGGNG